MLYTGIIPARAGSTCLQPCLDCWCMDHPRSRGEHLSRLSVSLCSVGSSPLARGAPIAMRRWADNWRIIPARAGSTMPFANAHAQNWDHPRSRGEHAADEFYDSLMRGSSPLARGAHLVQAGTAGAGGIIPARAGSTSSTSSCSALALDHPRSRGEHTILSICRTFR